MTIDHAVPSTTMTTTTTTSTDNNSAAAESPPPLPSSEFRIPLSLVQLQSCRLHHHNRQYQHRRNLRHYHNRAHAHDHDHDDRDLAARACLFGAPDARATGALVAEQFAAERRRFAAAWGFDIALGVPLVKNKDQGNKQVDKATTTTPKKVPSWNKENVSPVKQQQQGSNGGKPSPLKAGASLAERAQARSARRRRQAQMTDFWHYRKLSESSCSDKEN